MRKIKRDSLGEAGQGLVEFALVTLFVILPVTFGIIDGGILFYKWVTLNNGAREGARAGAIYHHTVAVPAVGTKDLVHSVDGAREQTIWQAVDATIGPLVTRDYWATTYDPDYRCIIEEGGGKCADNGYDVYRNGALVTVAITHTHSPFVGLVIGLHQIDLSAAATMRIEPGLSVSPG